MSPNKTMGPMRRDAHKYNSHPKEERKESFRTEAGESIMEDLRGEATPNQGFEGHPGAHQAERSTAHAKALRHDRAGACKGFDSGGA